MELIRLSDTGRSVSVRLHSSEPVLENRGVRYYSAEAIVSSDFVNGTVYLGFDSTDLDDWGLFLDAVEQMDEEDQDGDEPFTADWPGDGRTAYLRFVADDPYVVEVHDGPGTGIVVAVPVDMDEDWIAEARARLAAVRSVLGE
ncbi:DUF5959 family protein [Streptomyces morookaense]|uniref:DUF5959 family protein n=1 Tax=Streptomyces morookaense TaxID=1970 RepID=UPI0033E60566